MSRDEKLDLLARVPLFAGLGRRQLERLGMLTEEVDLPQGRTLMRQGERGTELMVIVDGTVSVERGGQQIAERGAGEVLGEMALLDGGPRTATVTLTSPGRLLIVGRREFDALMEEFPDVRLRILETLAGRLRSLETDGLH
jgi:CRP/FNR family transcriptional regulator, cyclic AMP receptor protein